MKRNTGVALISIWAACLLGGGPLLAQQDAPPGVAAALVVKVASFEKRLSSGGALDVYVLGAPEVASELKKVAGQSMGGVMLRNVHSGPDLPSAKPSILYVGDASKVAAAAAYARANKVLTMTGRPDLVPKGLTVGFGIGGDGKPAITLNLTATAEEGVSWDPSIMKVAKTVN